VYEDAFLSVHNKLDLKTGVMFDESITLNRKTALVICIRSVFPDFSEPSTFFCNFVALNNTSTSTILGLKFCCLHRHEFTREYLLRNLISFAADGASNMLGRKKCVAAVLVEMIPDVLAWH
jgi:hypothetical protein